MTCTGNCNQGRTCTCTTVDKTCTYCGQEGHRAHRCPRRAHANQFGVFIALRNVVLAWIVVGVLLWVTA